MNKPTLLGWTALISDAAMIGAIALIAVMFGTWGVLAYFVCALLTYVVLALTFRRETWDWIGICGYAWWLILILFFLVSRRMRRDAAA